MRDCYPFVDVDVFEPRDLDLFLVSDTYDLADLTVLRLIQQFDYILVLCPLRLEGPLMLLVTVTY